MLFISPYHVLYIPSIISYIPVIIALYMYVTALVYKNTFFTLMNNKFKGIFT